MAQLGDGLVALPADARTREQLDWIAESISAADGAVGIWLARPATAQQERDIAAAMATARAVEYDAVAAAAQAALDADPVTSASELRRLRGELRRIVRRDYFPPPEREAAQAAVAQLADASGLAKQEEPA